MKIVLSLLLIMFLFGGGFWVGGVVQAQDTVIPEVNCGNIACGDSTNLQTTLKCKNNFTNEICKVCCGNYRVNDVMILVVKVSNIVFGFIGSLVLFFFIYGGFLFLTAAGSNERVTKGKRVIIGSIIGLLIVFFSYTIVGYIFSVLDIPNAGSFASNNWF